MAAALSVACAPSQRETQDVITRLDELKQAVRSALRVNKHLNAEVESYIVSLEGTTKERDAWQQHARQLARLLAAARKRAAASSSAGVPPPSVAPSAPVPGHAPAAEEQDVELERLVAELARLPDPGTRDGLAAGDGHGGAAVSLSPSQRHLHDALVARGRAGGWLVDKREVVLGPVLGRGVFGVTHKGTWRGTHVAVKLVRTSEEGELTNFLREVEVLAALRHPHILPFLGAVMQAPDHFWLLSELQTGGTLTQWLYPSGPPAPGVTTTVTPRTFTQRLQMAYEVAQGMQALEASHPPILHRDLKPSNVFVDAGGHARLREVGMVLRLLPKISGGEVLRRAGDFGLARRLLPEDAASLTGETGTYLYMAPEVMRHEVYDNRADVWSWGVMLVELLTGVPPYSTTYLTPVQVAMGVAEESLSPVMPTSIPTDLQVLGRLACDFNPEGRPNFQLINEELSTIVTALTAKPSQIATAPAGLQALATSAWKTVFGRIYSQPPAELAVKASAKSAASAAHFSGVRRVV